MSTTPNLSTTCMSGPRCFLLKYISLGAGRLNGPRIRPVHDTWEDAARCEKRLGLFNDRPAN